MEEEHLYFFGIFFNDEDKPDTKKQLLLTEKQKKLFADLIISFTKDEGLETHPSEYDLTYKFNIN